MLLSKLFIQQNTIMKIDVIGSTFLFLLFKSVLNSIFLLNAVNFPRVQTEGPDCKKLGSWFSL